MNEYNEASVSFNVRAVSPTGFDCMLTIRSNDGGDLVPRALKALQWLEDQGFSSNGRRVSKGASNGDNDSTSSESARVCPTHNKPMRPSKFGDGWYCPVKVSNDDGTGKAEHCRQRVKA